MKLLTKANILPLFLGILLGVFLCRMQIIPEMFKNTKGVRTITIQPFLTVKFKNPEVYDENLPKEMNFNKHHFNITGYFRRDKTVGTSSSYFVKIAHNNDGKKLMQFGDPSRDLQIESATINTKQLKGEKCIVKPREIIILPSDHKDAPDTLVEYRI